MEDAKTLIRMAARAFYGNAGVRLTLIIDALAIHSTLPNEDLSQLLGIQQKDLRKLCGKLREDRMISVHSRQEIREGMQRPIHRDWYYLNFYSTIDAIKFRVMHLTNRVKDQFKPSEEKKDYFCPRCKSEWTQMEVLSSVSMATGEFACQKCGFDLERHETSEADRAGHERLSRLMSQLDPLIRMLRRIDEQNIPSNDFEQAEALRVPIQRDESLNPSRRLEPVVKKEGGGAMGAALAARMVKTDTAAAVEVSLVEADVAARERLEAARKQEAQNQLPEWHTMSTITGEKTALGLKEQARQAVTSSALLGGPDPDSDEKKAVIDVDADGVDQSMMDAYLTQLRAEQERQARGSGSDDDDDDDEDDEEDGDEDDEFEDVAGTSSSRPNGAPASSPLKRPSPDSDSATPATSAAPTPRPDDFPGRSPAKRARLDSDAPSSAPPSQPAPAAATADSDDEEEFEDAL